MCCQCGHVLLSLQSLPLQFLHSILENNEKQGKDFWASIRQYNMALTFTSLGVKEDTWVNRRGGWVFCVQGELSHSIATFHRDDGEPPSYAQLYIYDPDIALLHRMNRNGNLNVDTMRSLQTMLLQSYHYSHQFKHAYEILNDHVNIPNASIQLYVTPSQDLRRYNLSSTNEIAVILPGDGTSPERRDIIL